MTFRLIRLSRKATRQLVAKFVQAAWRQAKIAVLGVGGTKRKPNAGFISQLTEELFASKTSLPNGRPFYWVNVSTHFDWMLKWSSSSGDYFFLTQ